jgi:hypothetical protein
MPYPRFQGAPGERGVVGPLALLGGGHERACWGEERAGEVIVVGEMGHRRGRKGPHVLPGGRGAAPGPGGGVGGRLFSLRLMSMCGRR